MKRRLIWAIGLLLALAIPALSQQREEPQRPGEPRAGEPQRPAEPHGEMQRPTEEHPPRANQGHIPAPPPPRPSNAKPEAERMNGRVNNMPHVSNNQWYGHEKPNDPRYRVAQPFEHGHFEHFGPSYRYNVVRIDPNLRRFWLPGGYFFDVSPVDWPLAAGWCWNCGQDFVVYEDPDHPGWYLLYNIDTGAYVHVLYMGM